MAKRIALSGKPLSGKSTLAKFMWDKYGYRHASMSGFLIDEYVNALNAPWMVDARGGMVYDAADIYENKEAYRAGLQVMGDELGFQDPEKIVGVMRQILIQCGAWDLPDQPVVLEAIRGDVQASAARALGFVVVNLWIDEEEQAVRAKNLPSYLKVLEAMRSRPDLESGVIEGASIRITPAMPLENAARLLTILDEEGLSHGPADQTFEPGSLADWASIQ